MQANSIPSTRDIPFDVSPPARALLVEILSQLTTVKEEVAELRDENRQKDQRIDELEGTVAELRDENRQKDQRIAELEARLEAHENFDGRERATDRQRIAKLENRNKTVTSDTGAAYADKLHKLMLQSGTRQISVSNAAKLLGVSRMHAHRLKPLIASDPRFAIVKDTQHTQRHLIRIIKDGKL